jgi:hypothetical protein
MNTYGENFNGRHEEMVQELARRYGVGAVYSRCHSNPTAVIFYHRATGFALASYSPKTQSASIYPENELHVKLRIDKA